MTRESGNIQGPTILRTCESASTEGATFLRTCESENIEQPEILRTLKPVAFWVFWVSTLRPVLALLGG